MVLFVSLLKNFQSSCFISYLHILVSADDPVLQEALKTYHQRLITDNNKISELLLADYKIDMKYVFCVT